MTCAYCGTELPATALFCGECGRSLALSSARAASRVMAVSAPVVEAPLVVEAAAPVVEPAAPVGEPVEAPPTKSKSRSKAKAAPVEEPAAEVVEAVEPSDPVDVPPAPAPQPNDTVEISAWDVPVLEPAKQWSPPERLLRLEVNPIEDLEETRIVRQAAGGPRWVLQFSTGESVTVAGTGLVGRNPVPEPGEYFDQLVSIVDPGKSVSKTHLEFGQAAGKFWISDRYSGNGTVVREPDSTPKRCDPGKRYRIARGTRVTIGEQFFVVS